MEGKMKQVFWLIFAAIMVIGANIYRIHFWQMISVAMGCLIMAELQKVKLK